MAEETEKGARLQFGPDGYRIAVGEEVSEAGDFGSPLEFTAEDGTRYVGFADLPDEEGDPETHLDYWLYEAEPVECEPEEVDSFEDEEEDEEDEEEEPLVTTNGGNKDAAD